jgi:hypothetical protein
MVFLSMSKRMSVWYRPRPCVIAFCDHFLVHFHAVRHVHLELCLQTTQELDHCSYQSSLSTLKVCWLKEILNTPVIQGGSNMTGTVFV